MVRTHRDLEAYQLAYEVAMRIFELSRTFPREEVYSLTDQIRRSSRSVCSNITEGWRRRRYAPAFVNKLNEAESEAAEAQTWLEFAVDCRYLSRDEMAPMYDTYDRVIGKLVAMQNNPSPWLLPSRAGASRVG